MNRAGASTEGRLFHLFKMGEFKRGGFFRSVLTPRGAHRASPVPVARPFASGLVRADAKFKPNGATTFRKACKATQSVDEGLHDLMD